MEKKNIFRNEFLKTETERSPKNDYVFIKCYVILLSLQTLEKDINISNDHGKPSSLISFG